MNTLDMRFWKYVQIEPDSCWIWTGATQKGYGAIISGSRKDGSRKMERAHRLSWRLAHGQCAPGGMDVCHVCDIRRCVNPDHLFIGTRKDNIRDAVQKGRLRAWQIAKTHCKYGHPLNGHNLRYTAGKRRCRECSRRRTEERRARLELAS